MVLTYGDVSKFGDLKWYYLELRSERTIEPTLGRLGRNLKSIFQDSAVEIFIPISERDLNVCNLNTINCVYVRSTNFAKLLRLKTVTGVVGLLTKGDSLRPADALSLDNSFVQAEIAKAEAAYLERPRDLREGSFGRILDGEYRDWCGLVTSIHGEWAAVVIEIKTKIITVETPVQNLINKDHVPTALRKDDDRGSRDDRRRDDRGGSKNEDYDRSRSSRGDDSGRRDDYGGSRGDYGGSRGGYDDYRGSSGGGGGSRYDDYRR